MRRIRYVFPSSCHTLKVSLPDTSSFLCYIRSTTLQARRFITFIDAAYDSKTKLLTLSNEPITQIFSDTPSSKTNEKKNDNDEGYTAHQRAMMDDLGLDANTIGSSSIFTGDEEIFAFARAVSRLSEMGTRQWAERVKGA